MMVVLQREGKGRENAFYKQRKITKRGKTGEGGGKRGEETREL